MTIVRNITFNHNGYTIIINKDYDWIEFTYVNQHTLDEFKQKYDTYDEFDVIYDFDDVFDLFSFNVGTDKDYMKINQHMMTESLNGLDIFINCEYYNVMKNLNFLMPKIEQKQEQQEQIITPNKKQLYDHILKLEEYVDNLTKRVERLEQLAQEIISQKNNNTEYIDDTDTDVNICYSSDIIAQDDLSSVSSDSSDLEMPVVTGDEINDK